MGISYWKRRRDTGAQRRADDATPTRQEPTSRDDPGGTEPEPLQTIDLDALTRQDDLLDAGQRSAQYNDWVDRMRAKRQRAKALYSDPAAGAAPTADAPSYWTADAVFAEGRRVADNETPSRPNPWRVQELLEVLDLRDGATPTDVNQAYRQLAKQHHPDRYADADEDVRRYHAERMAVINQAYATLRQLERA